MCVCITLGYNISHIPGYYFRILFQVLKRIELKANKYTSILRRFRGSNRKSLDIQIPADLPSNVPGVAASSIQIKPFVLWSMNS